MAFRLRHWLGVAAASMLLVAFWRLPLESVPAGSFRTTSAAEERSVQVARQLRDARASLDQVRRASSLPGRIRASVEDGVGVFVSVEADVEPGQIRALRERVAAEADRAAGEPAMVVAYAYDGGAGSETGLAVSQTHRLETYLGRLEDAPYCAQVVVTRPAWVDELIRRDLDGTGWSGWSRSLLGPCAFYLRYGLAGPRIQEWLEAGGIALAYGRRDGTLRVPASPRRSVLGMGQIASLQMDRCMTGEREACAAAFLDPGLAAPQLSRDGIRELSPAIFAGNPRNGPFPAQDWFLLFDLEEEFGAERFGRFWTADSDVASAFSAAFGVELGDWLVDWLDRGPGIGRATPAPTLAATLSGLLVISLMTGFATLWQRRREVD